MALLMDIIINRVYQEKNLMIHLDICKRNQSFVFLYFSVKFFYSLFQVVESIGDLADRLHVPNIERHDSCSALIKVKKYNSVAREKNFFYLDFTRV